MRPSGPIGSSSNLRELRSRTSGSVFLYRERRILNIQRRGARYSSTEPIKLPYLTPGTRRSRLGDSSLRFPLFV